MVVCLNLFKCVPDKLDYVWLGARHTTSPAMRIAQLFILSSRLDKLVAKDYCNDVPSNTYEVFSTKYNFWDGQLHQAPRGDCPPFFTDKGVQFCFIRHRKLLFVCTAKQETSPSEVVELLMRVALLIKDLLGVLSEESVRKNTSLVYELLDEVLDFGIPQTVRADDLRPFIAHPVVVTHQSETLLDRLKRADFDDTTKCSDDAALSILNADVTEKNEIYVDVLERLTVIMQRDGSVVKAEVNGAVVLKSFLAGSPRITIGLSSEVVVQGLHQRGAPLGVTVPGSIMLDSVIFQEGVDASLFERDRLVSLCPSIGEMTALRYRCINPQLAVPFHVEYSLEIQSDTRGIVLLRIKAELPRSVTAVSVCVTVPLPQLTTSASGACVQGGGAANEYEWLEAERELRWHIARISGGIENEASIRFTTSGSITSAMRREVGPISLYFEIPQHSVTGVRVTTLQIDEKGTARSPSRWIRCITQSGSYISRTH